MFNFLKSKAKQKAEIRQMFPNLKYLETADAEFLDFVKQSGGDTTDMEKYFKDVEEKYYEPFLCRLNHKDFKIENVEDYSKDEFEEYEPYSPQLDSADYFMMNTFYPDYIRELAALWQSTMSMDIAIYYLCKKIKEADDPEQFVKENHNLIRLTAMQIRSDAVLRYEHLMRGFYLCCYAVDFKEISCSGLDNWSIISDSYIYKFNTPIGSVVTTPDGVDRMISPKITDKIFKYHAENKYNKFDWAPDGKTIAKKDFKIYEQIELNVLNALLCNRGNFLSMSKSIALLDNDTSMTFLTQFINNPSLFNFDSVVVDKYISGQTFDTTADDRDTYDRNLIPLENMLYNFCTLVTPERYNSDIDENNMTEKDIKEVTNGLLRIYDTLVKYWSKFPEYKE